MALNFTPGSGFTMLSSLEHDTTVTTRLQHMMAVNHPNSFLLIIIIAIDYLGGQRYKKAVNVANECEEIC